MLFHIGGKDVEVARHEVRDKVCPLWRHQGDIKPWPECVGIGGKFEDCQHFPNKRCCWEKYDKEQEPCET